MQDRTRIVSILGSCFRIAIVVIVLVFLKESLCAQDMQHHQECGHLYNAAVQAEQQNDLIEAELRYEECRDLAQKYRIKNIEAAALHRHAIIKARNKKFTESANLFRRAIELDPRNAKIQCDFAQLYIDRRDYDEAEILLKKAFDIDPNNPKVLFSLGSVIASQRGERQTEGLRYLKLAVGEAEAYKELARIYYSKGDITRAEYAEQRAKEKFAEPVPSTTYMLTAEKIPNNPPQSSASPSKTPPEVVNRVRQELVNAETKETITQAQRQMIVAAAQKPAAPSQTNPTPTNSAPVSPANPQAVATIPPKTAVSTSIADHTVKEFSHVVAKTEPPAAPAVIPAQPQPPASPPVDPFALVHPLDPPSDPFEQATPTTTLAAQTLLKQSEPMPQPVVQLPVANTKRENIPLVRVTENNPSGIPSTEPQLTKIATPTIVEAKPLQRVPLASDVRQKMLVPPIQSIPKEEKRVAQTERSNPLRQIPPGGAGLIDPSAETATITALPSYSAVGTKKLVTIASTKPQTIQENFGGSTVPMGTVPKIGEPPLAVAQPANIARTLESIGTPTQIKDVDVLQSPAAVLARRDLPMSKHDSLISVPVMNSAVTNTPSNNPQRPVVVKQEPQSVQKVPEYAKIIRGGQKFNSTSAPAVLKFGSVRNDPPPEVQAEKLVEIATTPQAAEPTRPLMIVKNGSADRLEKSADTYKPANTVPVVDPFLMAADTPLSMSEPSDEVQREELPPALPLLAAAPPVSLPIVEAATPKFAEVKRIESQPPALPAITSAPPALLPAIEEPVVKPKFAEVQRIEPRTPTLPPAASSPDSFLAVNDTPAMPKFAEVKKPEALPKAIVPSELSKLAEATSVPIRQPVMVRESIIRPLPPEEAPTGFASTRKKGSTAVAEDQSMGFARSRK